MAKWLLLPVFVLLASCGKQYLTVHQERIDRDFLASTFVGSPDPLQKAPPLGQRLILSWDFPLSLYREELTLFLTIRFWDNTEEKIAFAPERKRGIRTYFFENMEELQSKKLLTYLVEAKNRQGKTVSTWQHQLWCTLIEIED